MLFSEPKIPQIVAIRERAEDIRGFSALQRAENSSNLPVRWLRRRARRVSVLFSEPKIPQNARSVPTPVGRAGFSALQRAENSSKWLNSLVDIWNGWSFSALQRAENSSKEEAAQSEQRYALFQCSSASRKFLKPSAERRKQRAGRVSVLFSEPKIPQMVRASLLSASDSEFQCSSASRKFLKTVRPPGAYVSASVSVLFSEPKIPQNE